MWARHAKGDTIGEEEGTGGGVVKLAAVVALDATNGCRELSLDIGKKCERVENVSDFQRRGNIQT